VFDLPADKHIDALPKVLAGIRTELAVASYQGARLATELDEHIEEFCRQNIHEELGKLPS
jgi:hypothetical protein